MLSSDYQKFCLNGKKWGGFPPSNDLSRNSDWYRTKISMRTFETIIFLRWSILLKTSWGICELSDPKLRILKVYNILTLMRAAGSGDHGSLSRRCRQVQMWGPGAQVWLPLTHLATPQVGQLQRREHCCIIFHSFPSPKIVNSSSTERFSVEKGHSLVFTDHANVKTGWVL